MLSHTRVSGTAAADLRTKRSQVLRPRVCITHLRGAPARNVVAREGRTPERQNAQVREVRGAVVVWEEVPQCGRRAHVGGTGDLEDLRQVCQQRRARGQTHHRSCSQC